MKKENLILLSPLWFARVGHISVFTLLYGLFRILNVGEAGVVTICGLTILGWKPMPSEIEYA